MKLLTTLAPRSNDTVILRDASLKDPIIFTRDAESRELAAEVPGEALVAQLLASGNFQPHDEADFDAADELLEKFAPKDAADNVQVNADSTGDDFTEVVNGGLPTEANTPPVQKARPRGGSRARRASLG